MKNLNNFLLISIILMACNLSAQSIGEEEATELFNNIPVTEGIHAILEQTNYTYQYVNSSYVLSSYESWKTELEKLTYRDTPTRKIIFELGQSSEQAVLGCYNASLRLYYENEEVAAEEYYQLKSEFEEIGEKIVSESILDEDYVLKNQIVMIYFNKNKSIPDLSFSLGKNFSGEGFQVFIDYQVCNIN